jgi:hypothetical protein
MYTIARTQYILYSIDKEGYRLLGLNGITVQHIQSSSLTQDKECTHSDANKSKANVRVLYMIYQTILTESP